jgi:hypothetical protein
MARSPPSPKLKRSQNDWQARNDQQDASLERCINRVIERVTAKPTSYQSLQGRVKAIMHASSKNNGDAAGPRQVNKADLLVKAVHFQKAAHIVEGTTLPLLLEEEPPTCIKSRLTWAYHWCSVNVQNCVLNSNVWSRIVSKARHC